MSRPAYTLAESVEKRVAVGVCLWLAGLVVVFAVVSLRWPMVGDVSYLHYVVFLMRHGMVPYRDIVDMNLPGTYMLESAVMRVFGAGSGGWRAYDFGLMGVGVVSMVAILRRQRWLAGVFASAMFVLVHGQDGEIMSGERDFAVAVFLLAAVALLFVARRGMRHPYWAMGAAGVLLSFAANIKPTVLPLVVGLVAMTLWEVRGNGSAWRSSLAIGCGVAIPTIATCAFLLQHDASGAFVEALHGLIPYHASLAHRSLGYLIGHSVSPILPLLVLWLIAATVPGWRTEMQYERMVLLLGAAGGLISYLLQQKGFAYQRYPFLAFLLLLFADDFVRLARLRGMGRVVGVAGLLGCTVLCTTFLMRTMTFERGQPARPLLDDLRALGVSGGAVQCMDTAGGCIDGLNAGGIVQSTGFLYDCYLLDGSNEVALGLRKRFWEQMNRRSPRLVVVTDSVCYDPVRTFDKYGHWPEFQSFLAANYVLAKQSGVQSPVRYWSRSSVPFGYRIYERRTDIDGVTSSQAR